MAPRWIRYAFSAALIAAFVLSTACTSRGGRGGGGSKAKSDAQQIGDTGGTGGTGDETIVPFEPKDCDAECPAGQACWDGFCLPCVGGEIQCLGNNLVECAADGSEFTLAETCPTNGKCVNNKCLACYPGTKDCQGNVAVECRDDGSEWIDIQDCDLNSTTCTVGVCLSPCAGDLKQNTNAGCSFYAVDLQNVVSGDNDAASAQFAVIVSNTDEKHPAEVTLKHPDGTKENASVAPRTLHKFELPPSFGVDGTLVDYKAFEISATRPITVYQFNPLSNEVEVFSNDASVLLPVPNLGMEYRVMSYAFQDPAAAGTDLPGFFTVVGVSSLPTTVQFTVTAPTNGGGDIPALQAGQSHSVTLEQGQVLNVEANDAVADLTGSHIQANAPVAVFAGHECPFTGELCCCDHLEQQMLPVTTWGTQYLISKSWPRWNEKDYVRVVATKDGTNVTLDPAVAQVPVLQAGQHHTFQIGANVAIQSDKPVMVAQILASSYEILGKPKALTCTGDSDCPSGFSCDIFAQFCLGPECDSDADCSNGTTCEFQLEGFPPGNCAPIGDPAMILAVGEAQFTKGYVFLTPDAYLEDYVNIIAPLDATSVMLDGMAIDLGQMTPIGSSGFGAYRTVVGDGVHTVESDARVGVIAYGYDNDVSYGYPGGMALLNINN